MYNGASVKPNYQCCCDQKFHLAVLLLANGNTDFKLRDIVYNLCIVNMYEYRTRENPGNQADMSRK